MSAPTAFYHGAKGYLQCEKLLHGQMKKSNWQFSIRTAALIK